MNWSSAAYNAFTYQNQIHESQRIKSITKKKMIYSFDVPRTFVFVRVSVAVVEFKSVFFKIIILPPPHPWLRELVS